MAQYKGREVLIVRELPHPNGDQVTIEHKDLSLGTEIVPRNEVTLSSKEMEEVKKARETNGSSTEFNVSVEKKHTGIMVAPVTNRPKKEAL